MAYVHCMPALCASMTHGLDNVVTGILDVSGRRIEFRTRGHIVKATNKVYRGSPWKPAAGAALLVDGELGKDVIILDHVEPDSHDPTEQCVANPHLEQIASMLPGHPPASKTLRVWRAESSTRIRFAEAVSRRNQRGRIVNEILHGHHDSEGWRLWRVERDGGTRVGGGIDQAVLTILARAAGNGLLVGETAAEEDRRLQAELREARGSHAMETIPQPAAETPPFDDCPF